MKTKDTKIIFNKTIRIITSDWDAKAMDSIASGEGFRITEEGKTDTKEEPGYYRYTELVIMMNTLLRTDTRVNVVDTLVVVIKTLYALRVVQKYSSLMLI